jgi:hypothetical protein
MFRVAGFTHNGGREGLVAQEPGWGDNGASMNWMEARARDELLVDNDAPPTGGNAKRK